MIADTLRDSSVSSAGVVVGAHVNKSYDFINPGSKQLQNLKVKHLAAASKRNAGGNSGAAQALLTGTENHNPNNLVHHHYPPVRGGSSDNCTKPNLVSESTGSSGAAKYLLN